MENKDEKLWQMATERAKFKRTMLMFLVFNLLGYFRLGNWYAYEIHSCISFNRRNIYSKRIRQVKKPTTVIKL